jgi:hypothetical protein
MAQYRTVYFLPNPVLDGKVPIAVVLQQGATVSAIRFPHIPGAQCLGGAAERSVVEMILADLEESPDFKSLPMSVGPQVVVDDPQSIPVDADPIKWLEVAVLGSRRDDSVPKQGNDPSRIPQRATLGFRFLETYEVARYVRKTFQPGMVGPGDFLSGAAGAAALGAVSQYVVGDQQVLLMEPVLPRREKWEADVRRIARNFGAYQAVIRTRPKGPMEARLMAYLVPGGSVQRRSEIRGLLEPFADKVVDTSQRTTRDEFFRTIKRTALSGGYEEPFLQ